MKLVSLSLVGYHWVLLYFLVVIGFICVVVLLLIYCSLVRRHSFFPSFSIFKSAVLDIQFFLLALLLAIINFAFTCFSAVLFSDVGTDSAMSLAVFSSLCSFSRLLFQYGLYTFLAPFGMASSAACRIHLVNSLTTLLISLL